jgi:hypothetical protein
MNKFNCVYGSLVIESNCPGVVVKGIAQNSMVKGFWGISTKLVVEFVLIRPASEPANVFATDSIISVVAVLVKLVKPISSKNVGGIASSGRYMAGKSCVMT